MTAAALAHSLGADWPITLIESDEIGTVGVGEATIPHIRNFNAKLGLDEAEFLAATQGSYKLGIDFVGWNGPGSYMHTFGRVGRAMGGLPFHHYWLRAHLAGRAGPLDDYVMNGVVARGARFSHTPDRKQEDMLPPLRYAFHFDARLYAGFLRAYAEKRRPAIRREGRIVAVERNGESGDIAAVVLADGTRIAGDFFIDCSGFRGLLIEQELQSGFEDWTHWLRCDRAVAVPCAAAEPLRPYTTVTARTAGWQWHIPLQHRTGNGYVFSSAHVSEDEAAATLLANLDGEALGDPLLIRFRPGKRKLSWNRNVVAMGFASGFIEPLESTSIHLIHTAIDRLIEFLPRGPVASADRDAYNRAAHVEVDRIRDFVILHYYANARRGEAFWDGVRTMDIPEELAESIALFRASGRVVRAPSDLFTLNSWVQVMVGHGIMPKDYHPLADRLSDGQLDAFLGAVASAYAREAAALPDHGDYVARFCAAVPRAA
jgi:tryptophan halogenase